MPVGIPWLASASRRAQAGTPSVLPGSERACLRDEARPPFAYPWHARREGVLPGSRRAGPRREAALFARQQACARREAELLASRQGHPCRDAVLVASPQARLGDARAPIATGGALFAE